jgi:hypothetical protein
MGPFFVKCKQSRVLVAKSKISLKENALKLCQNLHIIVSFSRFGPIAVTRYCDNKA